MKMYELHKAVLQEVPGADLRDLYSLTNRKMRDVCDMRNWRWYETFSDIDITDSVSATECTVTNGDATLTGPASTFTAAMVGRKVRISGSPASTFTISSYTSATEVELDRTYPGTTDTDATILIFEDTYELPSDLRQISMVANISEDYEVTPLQIQEIHRRFQELTAEQPRAYAQSGGTDSTGKKNIILDRAPDDADTLRVYYWRYPTAPDSPEDELDMPTELEWIVHDEVILHVPMRPENKEFAETNRVQWFMTQRDLHVRNAKRNDAMISQTRYANKARAFHAPRNARLVHYANSWGQI